MIKLPIGNSAIIVAKGNNEKFIAVHRKENQELICLPGGKLESNEDVITGVVREVYEETGININPTHFRSIYAGICEGPQEYWVTTFLVEVEDDVVLNSEEPEMNPFWTTEEDFMKNAAFPEFYTKVFKVLKTIREI